MHESKQGPPPPILTLGSSYLYGCSPVCVLRCLVRFADLGKILPQYLGQREEVGEALGWSTLPFSRFLMQSPAQRPHGWWEELPCQNPT